MFPLCFFDIHHSHNLTKTYVVFDNVYLVKNISNNLLNYEKFVFLGFSLNDKLLASSKNGNISWYNFHDLHEEDAKQKAFFQTPPKITASALDLGNNKQMLHWHYQFFTRRQLQH